MGRLSGMMVVLALGLVPVAAWAGEPKLWIVPPLPVTDLAGCPTRAAQAVSGHSPEARQLTSDALVRWVGLEEQGTRVDFPVRGATGAEESLADLADQCFAFAVEGKIVVSGAILRPQSARLLRVPVLTLSSRQQGEGLRFEMLAAFPPKHATIAPAAWEDMLSRLRDSGIDTDFKVGALGRLARHIGTYHYDEVLDDVEVNHTLKTMMSPAELATLRENLLTMSPIGFSGECLILDGNKPHDSTRGKAIVAIRLRDGIVFAASLKNRTVTQYKDPREPFTPDAVFLWVQETSQQVEAWKELDKKK